MQLKRDINSQELENFLLRDNIYIEWVRIREFNGSGGRIELNHFGRYGNALKAQYRLAPGIAWGIV
jgi:hypothetical protein